MMKKKDKLKSSGLSERK